MVQRIRELEIREEEERQQKVAAGRKLLEQVMQANNAQARAKLRKKQDEIEEDLRIAEYLRAKELREQQQETEQERIRQDKEKEVARLRAQQERAQDRQSQIDELRAKRYQEAKVTWCSLGFIFIPCYFHFSFVLLLTIFVEAVFVFMCML